MWRKYPLCYCILRFIYCYGYGYGHIMVVHIIVNTAFSSVTMLFCVTQESSPFCDMHVMVSHKYKSATTMSLCSMLITAVEGIESVIKNFPRILHFFCNHFHLHFFSMLLTGWDWFATPTHTRDSISFPVP